MPDVRLVVPCFNEAARLNMTAFSEALTAQPRLGLCFVNDGSADDTAGVLRTFADHWPDRVSVMTLDRNQGKAEAVRRGMTHAALDSRHHYIGYWDADLSTPLAEVPQFLAAFERQPACVAAIGSRIKRLGSNIDRRAARHVLGRVFATAASLTLDLPVYDSQCGAKIFRASTVNGICAEPFLSRWCFDVEILARLTGKFGKAAVRQDVIEVPLSTWREVGGSKLRPIHILTMAIDLWRIRRRYSGAS